MKKIIALVMCIMMIGSLAACGDSSDTKEPNSSANIPESSVSVEEPENQTEENTEDPQPVVNDYGMPIEADNMLAVIEALIVTDEMLNSEYAIWNAEYVYNACGMLIASSGLSDLAGEISGEYVYVDADVVKQCVNAMFAGFDANKDDLPAIPENMNVSYDEANGRYGFPMGDYGDQHLTVYECTFEGSGSISIKAALESDSEGKQFSGKYDVFMNETTYKGTDSVFSYMINSFVMTEDAPVDNTDAQDAISKEQALAMIEDIYGEDGSEDPDTGNIIGYGYESLVTKNDVRYYNFRMSWLVIDENGMASHSSYLTNIFVSTDGTKVLEAYPGPDGWELSED